MLGLMVVSFSVLHQLFKSQGWIKATEASGTADGTSLLFSLTANALAGAIAMVVVIVWLRLIYGATVSDLGLTPQRGDVVLGLKGAFWFIPPVLLLSLLVSVLVPYHHPALESIASAKLAGAWIIMFVGTAFVVPAVEEFLFRVLLQGGLQRFSDPKLDSATSIQDESTIVPDRPDDPASVTTDSDLCAANNP